MDDGGITRQDRLADEGLALEVSLNRALAPLRTSADEAALYRPHSLPLAASLWRFRLFLRRCIAEEADYRQGFLFVPVFIGAGAVLWFTNPVEPSLIVLAILFLWSVAASFILRQRQRLLSKSLVAVVLVITGMGLAALESWRVGTVILDTPVTTTVTGKVERRERDAKGAWRYVLELQSTANPTLSRPPGRVQLVARGRDAPIAIGAVLSGRARLSPPSGPALPGLNDFAFGSYFDGIGATGFFYTAPVALPEVKTGAASHLDAAADWLYRLRTSIAERIRTVIGGDAGAFAASIVTDERRAISENTMEALRISGLAHIVAISGLNMALAAGIFFVGLRLAFSLFPGFSQRYPVKKIAAFAALIMTLAYYLISGFAVSAERAWLMMSILLIAVLADRPSISLRNVALAAIVIIVLSPHEVMGPSFQMSFAATLALVSAYGFWSRWRSEREDGWVARRPVWMVVSSKAATVVGGVVVTSLIGGLSTAMFSVEHFHRVTAFGLAANLAAMPVMSLIVMPFGLIGMLLMPFGLDQPFLTIMGYGMAMVIDIAKTVAGWGGAATIGQQSPWFLIVSTVGFLLMTLMRTRLALLGVPFILTGIGLMIGAQTTQKPDLLIFEDGSLVALVGNDAVASNRTRPTGFVYEQWKRALPLPDTHVPAIMLETPAAMEREAGAGGQADGAPKRPPPLSIAQRQEAHDQMSAAFEGAGLGADADAGAGAGARSSAATGRFSCRRQAWCVAKHASGVKIAVLSDSRYAGTACDVADIVVAQRYVPFTRCRSSALLLDRDTLRKTGSLALWLGGDGKAVARAQGAMAGQERPWSQHRFYRWRDQDFDTALPPDVLSMLTAGR